MKEATNLKDLSKLPVNTVFTIVSENHLWVIRINLDIKKVQILLDYSRVDFTVTGGNRVGWIVAKKSLYL